MDKVHIDFRVGPTENDLIRAGSIEWEEDSINENFLVNILKKAIKATKIQSELATICELDVFVNRRRKYEIGLIATFGKVLKPTIKKI